MKRDIPDEVARLRVPPNSPEAEQSVLGCLLNDPGSFDRVADLLRSADFYRLENRLIFDVCASLINACKPCDVVTVFEALQRTRRAEDAGGIAYLNELAVSVPSARNARGYAEIVREAAMLRQTIALSDETATAAFSGRRASDVVDEAQTKLAALAAAGTRKAPREIGAIVVQRLDRIQAIYDGEVAPAWALGFHALDGMLGGGVRPGELIIVAARPSVGKSSFSLQVALRMAGCGRRVLVLSQEMPDSQVADRALANIGGIDSMALRTGRMSDAEWGGLANATDELSRLSLHVDEEGGLTLGAIRAKARQVRPEVLVLDYLQLCSGSGRRGDNRNNEIEEITRGLKALAKSDGMAVIALSQLSRDPEKRGNKRPQLSDLRDSGGIEQDADTVLMLWTHQRIEGTPSRIVGLAIEKQREGPLGTVSMEFNGSTQRWAECNVNLNSAAKAHGGDL